MLHRILPLKNWEGFIETFMLFQKRSVLFQKCHPLTLLELDSMTVIFLGISQLFQTLSQLIGKGVIDLI